MAQTYVLHTDTDACTPGYRSRSVGDNAAVVAAVVVVVAVAAAAGDPPTPRGSCSDPMRTGTDTAPHTARRIPHAGAGVLRVYGCVVLVLVLVLVLGDELVGHTLLLLVAREARRVAKMMVILLTLMTIILCHFVLFYFVGSTRTRTLY